MVVNEDKLLGFESGQCLSCQDGHCFGAGEGRSLIFEGEKYTNPNVTTLYQGHPWMFLCSVNVGSRGRTVWYCSVCVVCRGPYVLVPSSRGHVLTGACIRFPFLPPAPGSSPRTWVLHRLGGISCHKLWRSGSVSQCLLDIQCAGPVDRESFGEI